MIYIVIFILLIYTIYILWLSSSFKNYKSTFVSKNPKISIIVAARNEELNIGFLLNCLISQEYPKEKIEFIIINDHSDDKTSQIIKDFIKKDKRILLIESKNIPDGISPKKWALKQGVDQSTGEILLFTDADCILGPQWSKKISSTFNNLNVGMVLGPSPLGISNNFWSKAIYVDSIALDAIMFASAIKGIPMTASGRNLAIRKEVFDLINGYESVNKFISGDDDLIMHLINDKGYKILPCIHQDVIVKSPAPESLLSFIKQRLRFASKGSSYYILNYIRWDFKFSLILIFITNIAVFSCQLNFIIYQQLIWLIPWLIKIFFDLFFIKSYLNILKIKINSYVYFFNSLWHPLYILIFGSLGSFIKIDWKGRKSDPVI